MARVAVKPGRRERRHALLAAIESRDADAIRGIAKQDPDIVSARNAHGNTPLSTALGAGDAGIVKLLIELGADVHSRNDGGSTLLDGAAGGPRDLADLLIAAGAEPGVTHAASMGDERLLARLLDSDPEALQRTRGRRRDTLLHLAAHAGREGAVVLLLERGADVQATNGHGHTPLSSAVEGRDAAARSAVARVLLAAGADPDTAAGYYGGGALHRAVLQRDLDLIRLLLEGGATIDRRDAAGKTALHDAVSVGGKALVSLILEHSPDLDMRTVRNRQQPGGETPLDYATHRKGKTALAELIRARMEET